MSHGRPAAKPVYIEEEDRAKKVQARLSKKMGAKKAALDSDSEGDAARPAPAKRAPSMAPIDANNIFHIMRNISIVGLLWREDEIACFARECQPSSSAPPLALPHLLFSTFLLRTYNLSFNREGPRGRGRKFTSEYASFSALLCALIASKCFN